MPFKTLLLALLTFVPLVSSGAEGVSCACEEFACRPCEVQVDLTFYTAKCGPENSRVKSCKRPTCEAVANQSQCLADLNKQSHRNGSFAANSAASGSASGIENVSASNEEHGGIQRAVASTTDSSKAFVVQPIGSISNSAGTTRLVHKGGPPTKADVSLNVYEGDLIETEKDGKVRVAFSDGNVMNVAPDSSVTIERHKKENGRPKTLLNLMYGKLRTQVNKANHYDDQTSYFRVKTKTAVAGVRGTDFVTSYYPGEKSWVTSIQTFEGRVKFGSEQPSANQEAYNEERNQRLEVAAGEKATFSIESPKSKSVNDFLLKSYIDKGLLSAITKMNEAESSALDKATDYKDLKSASNETLEAKGGREPASVGATDSLCHAPEGGFGTCAYSCEGPGCDQCLRRSCDAGGGWGLPTAIGKSYCDPGKTIVRQECFN